MLRLHADQTGSNRRRLDKIASQRALLAIYCVIRIEQNKECGMDGTIARMEEICT
jgi:hypothetical protein